MITKQMIKDGELDVFVFVVVHVRMCLSDESNRRMDARQRDAAVVRHTSLEHQFSCARKLETHD